MQTQETQKWRIFHLLALLIIVPALIAALAFLSSYFSGRRTINIDGLARNYHIHTPRGWNENTAVPLVLVYHMRQAAIPNLSD